jgi:hypothetical protein
MMAIIVSLHHLHAVDMSLGVPQNVLCFLRDAHIRVVYLNLAKYTLRFHVS